MKLEGQSRPSSWVSSELVSDGFYYDSQGWSDNFSKEAFPPSCCPQYLWSQRGKQLVMAFSISKISVWPVSSLFPKRLCCWDCERHGFKPSVCSEICLNHRNALRWRKRLEPISLYPFCFYFQMSEEHGINDGSLKDPLLTIWDTRN